MKIYIKYMVSLRCKMVIRDVLHNMGFMDFTVILGETEIFDEVSEEQLQSLSRELSKFGFWILDSKKAMIIEKIKNVVIESVHYADAPLKVNFSHFLVSKLGFDYNFMSDLFSETTGATIEQFVISHKIERAKELLLYDELNLTEISRSLGYSSCAHLSNQFKKITGLTPTYFKNLKENRRRIALEDI